MPAANSLTLGQIFIDQNDLTVVLSNTLRLSASRVLTNLNFIAQKQENLIHFFKDNNVKIRAGTARTNASLLLTHTCVHISDPLIQ